MDIKDIKIPGMHKVENYLAAISAVWGMVDIETIKRCRRLSAVLNTERSL